MAMIYFLVFIYHFHFSFLSLTVKGNTHVYYPSLVIRLHGILGRCSWTIWNFFGQFFFFVKYSRSLAFMIHASDRHQYVVAFVY